ncbi:MAG: 3-keto-5-aminohexanoate cleavage protein [Desulfobacteraceae bacterium]|nr:3-keto-5-aminohexanoate cleavage protein [Desulfobacteraceae bacterium]
MRTNNKVVLTAAITGVLTSPKKFNVPVTPEEMADATEQAHNQGATIVHTHFRDQREGLGEMPTWDPDTVGDILSAIRERVPDIIICMSTGVMGNDISGPLACLEKFKPQMAACNAGSLNYLKVRKDGNWAWPPLMFDNPVEKISRFLEVMHENNVIPEFECFDTGIVRSVKMFQANGMFQGDAHVSFVMGVDSGMPANPDLLPILIEELPENALFQTIATGSMRENIWRVHRRSLELGGNVRTGMEDTFYLPNGEKARDNGELVEALANIAKEVGREVASPEEAHQIMGINA